jgi:hypothetical protein
MSPAAWRQTAYVCIHIHPITASRLHHQRTVHWAAQSAASWPRAGLGATDRTGGCNDTLPLHLRSCLSTRGMYSRKASSFSGLGSSLAQLSVRHSRSRAPVPLGADTEANEPIIWNMERGCCTGRVAGERYRGEGGGAHHWMNVRSLAKNVLGSILTVVRGAIFLLTVVVMGCVRWRPAHGRQRRMSSSDTECDITLGSSFRAVHESIPTTLKYG